MTRLVVIAPLADGGRERALRLLEQGPPFDLQATAFDRHQVYLSDREVVFVFEGPGEATLRLAGEDAALWRAAEAWQACLAAPPRVAATAFAWERVETPDGVSFEPTPGPGDSEGGDVYPP